MENKHARYIIPLIFSIIGIAVTFILLNIFSELILRDRPTFDSVRILPGNALSDSRLLIIIMIPVYILEFFILTLPVAVIMLIGNRIVKSVRYTQSVVHIGERFSATRIIERAVAPAFFSLSFSALILQYAPDWLYNQPAIPLDATIRFLYDTPLASINGALITLAVALAIYMPTWYLNDAGIVSHLKTSQLDNRQCPDTHAVGKWYSNFISGFALITYPITIVPLYFSQILSLQEGQELPKLFFISATWAFSLPILVMAFIIPVILFHEILLGKSSKVIQGIARRFGAGEIYVKDLDDVMLDVSQTLAEDVDDDKYSIT
jgi:hypothetical protein